MTDRDTLDPNGELEGLYHAYPPETRAKRQARIAQEAAEEAKEREWVRALSTATVLIDRLLPSNHERGAACVRYKTISESQAIVAHLERLGYASVVTLETEPEDEGSEYCHTVTVQGPYVFKMGGRYHRKDIPDGALVSVWGGPKESWIEAKIDGNGFTVGCLTDDDFRRRSFWNIDKREGRQWDYHRDNNKVRIIALGLTGTETARDVEALVTAFDARMSVVSTAQ